MSLSVIDHVNMAIQSVGGDDFITSLTEGTNEATNANLRYDQSRRALLESHYWNFALKRASLNRLTETPAFDFNYQFQLPSDYLRMVGTERQLDSAAVGDPSFNGYVTVSYETVFNLPDRYRIEGDKLLYDDQDCKILYVRDLEDTSLFTPTFSDALIMKIAADMAYKITGSRTVEADARVQAERALEHAKVTDAQQGTRERVQRSTLLASRW